VAGLGDVNGDGYADVAIAAPNANGNSGAVFVLLGSATGVGDSTPASADEQVSGGSNTFLGYSLSGARDVNGDGFGDLLIGATVVQFATTSSAALLLPGNGEGRPVLARQRRGDGSGIAVSPWGGSGSLTGFVAELRGSHPDGSGRVRGEFEACPVAVPMGDPSCTGALTPGWVDVGPTAPDVLLSHEFAGLGPGGLYRWRARVLRAPATGPLPVVPEAGPWHRPHAQAVEGDIRMLPEPGLVASLVSGLALLGALASRRARQRG
jgi:hypothetical protein